MLLAWLTRLIPIFAYPDLVVISHINSIPRVNLIFAPLRCIGFACYYFPRTIGTWQCVCPVHSSPLVAAIGYHITRVVVRLCDIKGFCCFALLLIFLFLILLLFLFLLLLLLFFLFLFLFLFFLFLFFLFFLLNLFLSLLLLFFLLFLHLILLLLLLLFLFLLFLILFFLFLALSLRYFLILPIILNCARILFSNNAEILRMTNIFPI